MGCDSVYFCKLVPAFGRLLCFLFSVYKLRLQVQPKRRYPSANGLIGVTFETSVVLILAFFRTSPSRTFCFLLVRAHFSRFPIIKRWNASQYSVEKLLLGFGYPDFFFDSLFHSHTEQTLGAPCLGQEVGVDLRLRRLVTGRSSNKVVTLRGLTVLLDDDIGHLRTNCRISIIIFFCIMRCVGHSLEIFC